VKDGVSETLTADEMYRVTMTAGPAGFYYSVFEQTNASPEVTLYELPRDGIASRELAKASGIPFVGQARSAGALVPDLSTGMFRLHAFTALGNNVFHLVFIAPDFAVAAANPVQIGTTYDIGNPRRHPVAMKLANGEIVGAWINNDGTVSIGSATRNPATALATGAIRISQVAPITSGDTPGVLWTSPSGVNAQILGGTPAPITTCNTQLGTYLSATSAELLPGLWLASWTKAGMGYLVNEGKGLACMGTVCGSSPTCGGADQETQGLRNPAIATAVRPSDPPGTVLLASATPALGPGSDGASVTSAIGLSVARMTFRQGSVEAMTEPIGSVELSRMAPIGAEYEGPDWPAVAILPPNKVAVAWLEPVASGGDRLRLERYRICLP
jgi:hypothetical protein